jgi:hypothetical protein
MPVLSLLTNSVEPSTYEDDSRVASKRVTGICFLDFIHRPYVPLRFRGWFFPRPQVKPTLLGPFDRAS